MICDFDIVDIKNLNRQFYFIDQAGKSKVKMLKQNLLRINPAAEIKIKKIKINKSNLLGIFQDCDVIVEAFDRAECKQMIVAEFINTEKLLVAASGIAGHSRSDDIKTHCLKKNFYIIGDLKSEAGNSLPPFSPRVNIAAAKQANVILDYFMKKL